MSNIVKARAELHELADIMDRRKALAPFAATLRDIVEKYTYRKGNNVALNKAVKKVKKTGKAKKAVKAKKTSR
jgi:hypothetical protein